MQKINSIRTGFLSLILTLGSLLFLPSPPTQASFLDDVVNGTLKAGELENYKIRQNVNGTFDLPEDQIKGSYQINIGTQTDNSCGLNCKTQYEIDGRIDLSTKEYPDDMSGVMSEEKLRHLQFDASILSLNQGKEHYFKWNELNINGDDVEFDREVLEDLNQTLGNKWASLSEEELKQWFYGTEGQPEDSDSFSDKLNEKILKQLEEDKEKPAKEILLNLFKTGIEEMKVDNKIDEEKADIGLKAIKIFLDSKLFLIYGVNSEKDEGFKKAIFNRLFFMNALDKVEKEIGEPLGENNRNELRAFLEKIKLSFVYRFNTTGLMDIFVAHFEWQDENNLEKFNLNYRQQIWGQGQARVMEKPKEVMSLEEWIDLFSSVVSTHTLNSMPTYPPVEIKTPADLAL